MFHVPEKFRLMKPHPLGSDDSYGNNGAFVIPSNFGKHRTLYIIASDGKDSEQEFPQRWEHVSVHVHDSHLDKDRTPLWDEMCQVKGIFWDEDDVVMQLHPARSQYVNMHENTLHLWRPVFVEIPTPPAIFVGLR